MKEVILTEKLLNELPIHDSDFLELSFLQRDTGEKDMILKIALYDDYDDAGCRGSDFLKSVITPSREMSFLFKDCTAINFITHCGMLRPDSIDFIEVNDEISDLRNKKTVTLQLSSGVRLTCETELITIISPP